MIKELSSAKEVVRSILESSPTARDSDKYLIWKYFSDYLDVFDVPWYVFKRTFSTETLRRVRQKYHEEGLYLPGTSIIEIRAKEAADVKDFISGATIDDF